MASSTPSFPRLTPMVGRIIAANAVVQLLLATILTSREVVSLLQFSPSAGLAQPWTIGSYMFVHSGLLHLATNMFGLYVFGTAVENRMGSRPFLFYYLYCGVGAAVFAMLVNLLTPLPPFVGASGAVMGVALAFAAFWPDAEIMVFPIPIPIKVRTLVILLAVMDLVIAKLRPDGVAHEAHLGGLLFGWLFFRVQSVRQRRPTPERRQVERVVMVQSATRDSEPRAVVPVRPMAPRPGNDPVAAEVDRVLDKISANGIESLTSEERRFLDEVSKRKQREVN
jgi:membrane associated rhomboid family serine protease